MSDWGPFIFVIILAGGVGLLCWTIGAIYDRTKRIEIMLEELIENLVDQYEKDDKQ